MGKLAFLFLIYDQINHEDVWAKFFEKVDRNAYSIFVHYKENKPLKHFEKHKLSNCVPTQYSHVSLVEAQNVLLREALKDDKITHFIFVSGACIPLKNFRQVHDFLDRRYSYFNICPKTGWFEKHLKVSNKVYPKFVNKAHQWCILNTKHARVLTKDTDYLSWFDYDNGRAAPDEMCYVTKLFAKGLETELKTTPNLGVGGTTFTNCGDMAYPFPKAQDGLKNYSSISLEELEYLVKSKSLFARKFNRECNLNFPSYLSAITM